MGNCWTKNPAKCAHASSVPLSENGKSHNKVIKQPTPLESLNKSPMVASKVDASVTSSSNNPKSFSFNDLKSATKNFRSDFLLGEGGFGYVYKGWIDENTLAPTKPGTGVVVAIKKLKAESFQGHKEWLVCHFMPILFLLVKSDNRLLVYEFMPKGSLENHLFRKGVQPITWATRMKIAIDVARGMAFLHGLDANVIYRDLKASNILLDAEFNAKLSDFGLARDGPTGDNTHVSTRVVGTRGYAAPEYVATGHLNPKSDVYSFGVLLLELLSGRPAMEDERAGFVDKTLVEWAEPFLKDSKRVLRIMDTRLGGQYSKKGAQAVAAVALQCLHSDSKNRPSMVDVLATLEKLQTSRDMPIMTSPHVKLDHPGIKHTDK